MDGFSRRKTDEETEPSRDRLSVFGFRPSLRVWGRNEEARHGGQAGGLPACRSRHEVQGSPRAGRAGQGRQAAAGRPAPARQPAGRSADEIGQYGGVWRRGFLGPSDFNGVNRVIYDVLVRFAPDGADHRDEAGGERHPVGRLQDLDRQAPQGDEVVGRLALHRRRHHVLVQGRAAEQGPRAGRAGLDAEQGRLPGPGAEDRRPQRALDLQGAQHQLPARADHEGLRRPAVSRLPARQVPEAVPRHVRQEGRPGQDGGGRQVQDLGRAVRQQAEPLRQSGAAGHGRLDRLQPRSATRSSS